MRITSDMLVSHVLATYPETAAVFERHGLGCPSCLAAGMESVSAAAASHDVSLQSLLDDLNGQSADPVRKEP